MHACMQFDVYLSDLHYTEKVAIYYAKLVNLADFEVESDYVNAEYGVI